MDARIIEEIGALQAQISKLEEQLEQARMTRQQKFHYSTKGRKVVFEKPVRDRHIQQRTGVIAYMKKLSWKTHLTGPVVYFMIIPFIFLDLCVTVYQAICFWAWEIPKVKRRQYVFIDRHHLQYLNGAEKLYCMFCGYANGVTAFTREVSARTEKFWCPIKHATKVKHAHAHYQDYIEYGDVEAWFSKDDK